MAGAVSRISFLLAEFKHRDSPSHPVFSESPSRQVHFEDTNEWNLVHIAGTKSVWKGTLKAILFHFHAV